MANSYSRKSVTVAITIEGRRMAFPGFATKVQIKRQGSPELPSAKVQIWGLSEARLSELTMLAFNALSLKPNRIEITAEDEGNFRSVIFEGEITNSVPDFNAAPSPVLNVEAITASFAKLAPTPPVAVAGTQTAASLCEQFAKEAGLAFRNEGVTASLSDCVINGDPIHKLEWVARSVEADLVIDDKEAVLIPASGSRGRTASVTAINAATGLVGYPSFDNMGIRLKTFLRPDLVVGQLMQVSSMLPRASGTWKIYSLEHELASGLPNGGAWFTSVAGTWQGG
jgi:hypothetical protein